MKPIKRLIICALFALCSLYASAYDFEVDGICYNVVSSEDLTCEVTYRYFTYKSYSGSITIPETVKYGNETYMVIGIGESAFYGCSLMSDITMPNSVTYIRDSAFLNCTGLTSVDISSSVSMIEDAAFAGCDALEKFKVSEDNQYYCAKDGVLYSKDMSTLVMFPLASPLLPSLYQIPESVSTIGNYAFSYCYDLFSITIGENVTKIGNYAFASCKNLTSLTLGNGVTTIGYRAFGGCSALTSLTIGNGVTTIGGFAFDSCTSLTSLTLGNGVETIGEYAFSYCSSLTYVDIPSSVSMIEGGAFRLCDALEEFKVSEENPYYCAKDGVLYSKDMLTLVLFPLASPLLSSYQIPESVSTIGNYAFSDCYDLFSITIGENVTKIGDYAFFCCKGLKNLIVGENVLKIGYCAFCNCSALTSLNLPNNVVEIDEMAFEDCSGLTSLTLGNKVRTIKSWAFDGCAGLKSIYSLNPGPPVCDRGSIFRGVDTESCILYVSIGSYDAYATADQWQDFRNIIEMDMTGIEPLTPNGAEIVGYYTINGMKIPAPQKGVNIIRYSDGTTKKLLEK